jgi:hypothetical protein
MIGQPAPTHPGEFPVAVAFSTKHALACAVSTGAMSGVSCYAVTRMGLEPSGPFLPLPIAQTTTPPSGPANTAADIVFNPSETALWVSVKGMPGTPGALYAFPVAKNGTVNPGAVVSRPGGLVLDFSLNFIGSDARALVTDPSHGASFIDISSSLAATLAARVEIANQTATCWGVYAPAFGAAYVFDGASPDVVVLDPSKGAIKGIMRGLKEAGGSFDAVAVGAYLYVLAGKPGISVFDLNKSQVAKFVDLGGLGKRDGWQGLAAYMA